MELCKLVLLTNTSILDLIQKELFHFLLVDLVKMYQFLEKMSSSSVNLGKKKKDILILDEGIHKD